jgi:hypothetical protein
VRVTMPSSILSHCSTPIIAPLPYLSQRYCCLTHSPARCRPLPLPRETTISPTSTLKVCLGAIAAGILTRHRSARRYRPTGVLTHHTRKTRTDMAWKTSGASPAESGRWWHDPAPAGLRRWRTKSRLPPSTLGPPLLSQRKKEVDDRSAKSPTVNLRNPPGNTQCPSTSLNEGFPEQDSCRRRSCRPSFTNLAASSANGYTDPLDRHGNQSAGDVV